VSAALKRLNGVESVEVSLEKGTVDIKLAAGNELSLPRIRREIRSNGNETKDAQVTARGRFRDRGGTPIFDLLNGATMELDGRPGKEHTETVEITGVSTELTKDSERLKVAGIKALPK
jgi:copper chaperone CopZ